MLIFGTCTVVFQKTIFSLDAEGLSGDVHLFEKPWFQTEMMFIGMFGCLFVFEGKSVISYFLKKKKLSKQPEVSQETNEKPQGQSHFKTYIVVAIPACCDLTATCLMNVGLLWIPASIWQMLRGSMTVFSAIFSKFCLKRRMLLYRWVGVCFVVFALVVVAFCCIMAPTGDPTYTEDLDGEQIVEGENTNIGLEIVGICLVVFAQIIQASQIVIEEFLLKDAHVDPILIVGLEGMWGGLICSGLCLPVVQWIIPDSVVGLYESTTDTFVMLINNPLLIFMCLIYSIVILVYNLFGMLTTQVSSAVIRTILEGLRTACIWIVQLIIGWIAGPSSPLGESWSDWSYLQVAGFLFLLEGLFVYNGIVKISCLKYEDDEPKVAPITEEDTPIQTINDDK